MTRVDSTTLEIGIGAEKEKRGWWRGNEEEWPSPGQRLLPPTDAHPSPTPPPGTTPCISSRAHRLEGWQVLTNHTDTLITVRSAVSSGTGKSQIPSPLRVLHQFQICTPSSGSNLGPQASYPSGEAFGKHWLSPQMSGILGPALSSALDLA